MTRTPLSGSKGQRSRSLGRFTHRPVNVSGRCSGERGNVLAVGTYCYVAVCRRSRLGGARRFGAHRGRRGAGAYRGGRPPTACSGVTAGTANATAVRFCFVPFVCSGATPRSDYISQTNYSKYIPSQKIFICIQCFDTVGWASDL